MAFDLRGDAPEPPHENVAPAPAPPPDHLVPARFFAISLRTTALVDSGCIHITEPVFPEVTPEYPDLTFAPTRVATNTWRIRCGAPFAHVTVYDELPTLPPVSGLHLCPKPGCREVLDLLMQ